MVCLATPPVVMVLAAWLGARVGLALESHALFFLGMLSFASVALVFLVTQELLIEVHNCLSALSLWLTFFMPASFPDLRRHACVHSFSPIFDVLATLRLSFI